MTSAEAAQSMRAAARKLRAWANALPPSMACDQAAAFHRVLTREAERLETDADTLAPLTAQAESEASE